MVIDAHTHVFPGEVIERRANHAAVDGLFGALYGRPASRLAGAEELIWNMDRVGIQRSVIAGIAWSSLEVCRAHNDYLLESVSRFPERLIAFTSVAPGSAADTEAEIERCAQTGARGIGELRPELLQPEALEGVFKAVRRHRLVVMLHVSEPVGHAYAGKGTSTPGKTLDLIAAYPDVVFICAHWGGGLPFYCLMPEVKTALRNTYFDSAASSLLYDDSVYQRVADLAGADRILFGSDWPLVDQARALQQIDALTLTDAHKHRLKHANAASLLGVDNRHD